MDGFLPLIEGFLAFALTMLALATAVSAVVGAGQRLRRRRAQGLRDMVRLLYLREVKPLLPKEQFEKKQDSNSIDPSITRRAEFIHDMTLMPLPIVVEKLETDEKHWQKKLESAEQLAGLPWYQILLYPNRVGRRWQTLGYGLEALNDAEFSHRLAESDAGKALRQSAAWTQRDLSSWDELADRLLRTFQTIGAASSETFGRHSRSWSLVAGFLLAFGVNVDSIDLLNSYLTDPQLRMSVIKRSDEIRAQQPAAAVEPDGTALAPLRDRLDSARQQLADTADGLMATVETRLSAVLGESRGSI